MSHLTHHTTSRRHRRCGLAAGVALVFLSAMNLLASVPAYAEESSTSLDNVALPAVAAGPDGVSLAAQPIDAPGETLDPNETRFVADAGVASVSQVVIDTSNLPDEEGQEFLEFSYRIARKPDNTAQGDRDPEQAAVMVTAQTADGDSSDWHTGDRLPAAGVVTLTWTFRDPGDYQIDITAHLVTTDDTDGPEHSTTTRYAFVIAGSGSDDPGDGEDPGDGDGAEWDVPNGTENAVGARVLNLGHIDVASLVENGELLTKVKDTTGSQTLWWHPEETVLQALPDSAAQVPNSPTYAFLGEPGSPIWILPETQDNRLLWPGWSTESIAQGEISSPVAWTLTDADGPGGFALFTSDPSDLGAVKVRFNTRDGITAEDTFTIPQHSHVHGSWTFGAEGHYCLAFERSVTLTSGDTVSDEFTLAFAVGKADVMQQDPQQCFSDDDKPDVADEHPMDDSDLTDDTAGAIRVDSGESDLRPGQRATVEVGSDYADAWVSPWFHSAPTWLGWTQVASDGTIRVRIPADAAAGEHQLVVKDREGNLIGWDSVALTTPPNNDNDQPEEPEEPDDDGSPGDDSDNPPEPNPCSVTATIIDAGHLDYASRIVDGALQSQVGDDRSGTKVYREPSETVLWLKPSSRVRLPDGFEAVGDPGSSMFIAPQTQNPELIWLGWNTETLNSSNASGPVTMQLTSVDGPGDLTVFFNDSFGGVQQVVFDHNAGSYQISQGVHAHANWAFSAEGIYRLQLSQSVKLPDGTTSTDQEILTIAVGDIDPASAIEGGANCVDDSDQAPGGNAPDGPGRGSSGPNPSAPDDPESDDPDDDSGEKSKAAASCTPPENSTATVLSAGHIDFASRIINGELQAQVGDDSSGAKVYREPSSTVLWLKPSAHRTLPAGLNQVGSAGASVWQVPQTQDPNLIWLGWNTELLNSGNSSSNVTWSLHGVSGPGTVKIYTTGSFGGIQEMVFNNGGTYQIPLGVHAHANWAFSAEGIYRLHFTQSVILANGERSTDSEVLTLAVGDVDPHQVAASSTDDNCGAESNPDGNGAKLENQPRTADEQSQAKAAQLSGVSIPETPQGNEPQTEPTPQTEADAVPDTAQADTAVVTTLLIVLGGVLLAGAGATGMVWHRRARWAALATEL